MAASRQDVDRWIEEAKKKKATHIISVCDTYDYDDYPVYVLEGEDVEKKKAKVRSESMQRINEVIVIHKNGKVTEGM